MLLPATSHINSLYFFFVVLSFIYVIAILLLYGISHLGSRNLHGSPQWQGLLRE